MESLFHTLKTELVLHWAYATHDEARRDLFAYVKGFYNRGRLHWAWATEHLARQSGEHRA